MPTHIQGASSQKIEVVPVSEIYHLKADDLNFIIYFYAGGPFSLDCAQSYLKKGVCHVVMHVRHAVMCVASMQPVLNTTVIVPLLEGYRALITAGTI